MSRWVTPGSDAPQNLPWIHDAVRVERLLHAAHELELQRVRVALELEDLQLTDAMLRGEAAAEFLDQVVDRAPQLRLDGLQLRRQETRALIHVEVQVAIAEMAVRHEHALRHVSLDPGTRDLDEARY